MHTPRRGILPKKKGPEHDRKQRKAPPPPIFLEREKTPQPKEKKSGVKYIGRPAVKRRMPRFKSTIIMHNPPEEVRKIAAALCGSKNDEVYIYDSGTGTPVMMLKDGTIISRYMRHRQLLRDKVDAERGGKKIWELPLPSPLTKPFQHAKDGDFLPTGEPRHPDDNIGVNVTLMPHRAFENLKLQMYGDGKTIAKTRPLPTPPPLPASHPRATDINIALPRWMKKRDVRDAVWKVKETHVAARLREVDETPGPADYKLPPLLGCSKKHSITKEKRPAFTLHSKHKHLLNLGVTGPGPKYLPPASYTRMGDSAGPAMNLKSRNPDPLPLGEPGPADYNTTRCIPNNKPYPPKWTCRPKPTYKPAQLNTPGPAGYGLGDTIGQENMTFPTDPQYSLYGHRGSPVSVERVIPDVIPPGPCYYDPTNLDLYKHRQPGYTKYIMDRQPHRPPPVTPGPAEHDLSKVSADKRKAPSYTHGKRRKARVYDPLMANSQRVQLGINNFLNT